MATSILSIGVAIIVLVLVLVISQELRDTDTISAANSGFNDNETLTTVTEAGENVEAISEPGANCNILIATNSTGGEIISSGNYTTSNNACTILAVSTSTYNNTDWNVSYTFTFGDEAYTSANKSLVGLGTFGDFVSIIVLALVAGIVLGIIFGVFGGLGGTGGRAGRRR
jgi:hypothetical protein